MKQKMWVRKHGTTWEAGCQRCGRIVYADWAWHWVLEAAREHAGRHA